MLSIFYDGSENHGHLWEACKRLRERALGNQNYQICDMRRQHFYWYDNVLATHICTQFGDEIGVYARLYPHFLRAHPASRFLTGVELQALCINADIKGEGEAQAHFFHATELILIKALRLTALNEQSQLSLRVPFSRLGIIRGLELPCTRVDYCADGSANVQIEACDEVLSALGSQMPEPEPELGSEKEKETEPEQEEVAA